MLSKGAEMVLVSKARVGRSGGELQKAVGGVDPAVGVFEGGESVRGDRVRASLGIEYPRGLFTSRHGNALFGS